MTEGVSSEWAAAFRQKSNYMKSWKPASTPSNRDRLELYALHKQAISGDAPDTNHAKNPSAGEKAKFQVWRSKVGTPVEEAMRLYCQEADRQVRVYGLSSASASITPTNTPAEPVTNGTPSRTTTPERQPRGLAAIPLLCAAASESRQAYLRRMSQTVLRQAWWKRQEPLTATPGSFFALPEHLLLAIASLLEQISLQVQQDNFSSWLPLPASVVQSLLWPWHNSMLAWWMGYILINTSWVASLELCQTILLGSRRTGLSLPSIWNDQVQFVAQSIHIVTEAHQPLSARLVGLCLLPLSSLISMTGLLLSSQDTNANAASAHAETSNSFMLLVASGLYAMGLSCLWWYWFLVLPCITWAWWMAALVAGQCFAVIELAGV